MSEFTLHPNVYATGGAKNLINLLEKVWVREQKLGEGSFYIISGFGNYNGGVRFFPLFKDHIKKGGNVTAIFSGSTSQKLTSKQLVKGLLECGSKVYIVNRKRILHAKCYGSLCGQNENLIVSSGNFTGPGMSQNVEASLFLDEKLTKSINFSWETMISQMLGQSWEIYQPENENLSSPAWQLLYDEESKEITLDETEKVSIIITLSHSDTARINAQPNTNEAKGTQYFWLSRDCYAFFPPLTILNERGNKKTYSCLINLRYLDLGETKKDTRVTFEAENNLDFRLGTGRLRYTHLVEKGDLAVITRLGEKDYSLKLARKGTSLFKLLSPYAINFIGHKEKRYGYVSNDDLEKLFKIN